MRISTQRGRLFVGHSSGMLVRTLGMRMQGGSRVMVFEHLLRWHLEPVLVHWGHQDLLFAGHRSGMLVHTVGLLSPVMVFEPWSLSMYSGGTRCRCWCIGVEASQKTEVFQNPQKTIP